MEYIYAALLLHNAGKAITEETITAVLKAAGVEVNEARAKALVAALDGVDIEEAISKAAFAAPAAAAPAAAAPAAAAPVEEVEEEEEDTSEEDGMAGLGALFG
ncbi:MAG TPA: 50S ribosomal protein P1 [Methanosarcina barkeri]|uniref:Large ribosomal subunit protein P1 n=1 Tax=Methanosarcina baikalica TaxID=3073890 RepID=A0ABU2D0B3_9EURY|nr:50S ribosomal protein P1 [Methanosarcina sp. Z-7115]MCO5382156.1 50S ribosomal protein P1 [Methanosarcina sp. ERenArc_MAG2]MDR7665434.1 50S ribosomal protein P1 [Methanosarcina sp. Z-7115]HWQ44397.1 50S ribosomal protein P1 [Methanosarcina barkeri]